MPNAGEDSNSGGLPVSGGFFTHISHISRLAQRLGSTGAIDQVPICTHARTHTRTHTHNVNRASLHAMLASKHNDAYSGLHSS